MDVSFDNLKKQDHVCAINFVAPLNLERFYDFETRSWNSSKRLLLSVSREEKKAMELTETSYKCQGNQYTVGLPWKKDKALLPNNYLLAKKRHFSLEKNRLKDKAKAKMYDVALMEYKRNGWARPLSKREVQAEVTPVYYLPHHGVYSLKRKSTPLRIIFELLPTGRSMSHRKSAWGPASLS